MELTGYEKEHVERLRGQLAECTVLLKKSGSFPLEAPGKLALYGSGARHTIKGGTGSGEVNSRYFVTCEQALRDAGFTLTTDAWLDAYDRILADARKKFIKELRDSAGGDGMSAAMKAMGAVMPEPEYDLPLDGEGDTAVYVLSRNSGEGNDRNPGEGDVSLSKTEVRDILALNGKYARFLLVLNVGGPVDLRPVQEIKDILVLSQLGVETGTALAQILLGQAYPSGKLTTSWISAEEIPFGEDFGDINDTRYREGIYMGYRYFDSVGKKADYPFGYGISYTEFEISGAELIREEQDAVCIRAEVKNIGKYPGKEVLQLYVSAPEGELDQPYQRLAAYAKTTLLAPGEVQILEMSIRLRDLASYSEKRESYLLESGEYIFRLGTNSTDTAICGAVYLLDTVVVKKVKNLLGTPDFADWKPEKKRVSVVPDEVTRISVKASDFPETQVISYELTEEIDPLIAQMTDEELAYTAMGAFPETEKGGFGVIGNAAFSVAGAAGETVRRFRDRGIPSLVMADGPAGLRIARSYFETPEGPIAVGKVLPEGLLEFLSEEEIERMGGGEVKLPEGKTAKTQYATAIPIGTAIAQSWNVAFAEDCGDIVGSEMERFGVKLWLAPALNLHRNLRCGRNFEYYSEDPLISGTMAAGITRGVQRHPGCAVTIKHYAANNQETNRYNSNSIVSERAMRELYLKGFELCVRLSRPYALMSSYNLVNGVHTSESYALTQEILRGEFGFTGIVMTDWVIGEGTFEKRSVHPSPKADRIAAAGQDLVMPGGKLHYDQVLAALKDGSLDRARVRKNATRVLTMARMLTD